jgi:hypothetical protein
MTNRDIGARFKETASHLNRDGELEGALQGSDWWRRAPEGYRAAGIGQAS